MKIWRLKSKEERRFKQGHPWAYSNELQESPKGITPGEMVELHDAAGNSLAVGFGNPGSLIAFRALGGVRLLSEVSRVKEVEIPLLFASLIERAFEFRSRWFEQTASCRVVYGEVDGLPGLVIDRFVSSGGGADKKIIYVVQPHSAGMDKHLEFVLQALRIAHEKFAPQFSAVAILRRDAKSREREGIPVHLTEVLNLESLQPLKQTDFLSPFAFMVPGVAQKSVQITADLLKGQKTGFFFDQLENIRMTSELLLRKLALSPEQKEIKILDLCSYVGQWGVQLADVVMGTSKRTVSVTMVDASESALALAEQNLSKNFTEEKGSKRLSVRTVKADVLDPMPALGEEKFDVVIADPPALIKSRKVIPQGKQAYVQLMTEAIRRTKPGGLIVACSCSQLLSPDDLVEVLAKAARRSQPVRWLKQGSASLDHFQRFEFREGNYLKCWVGEVE